MFPYLNVDLKDPPRNASSICTHQPNINTRDITATVFSQKASLSPPHMPIMCLIRASLFTNAVPSADMNSTGKGKGKGIPSHAWKGP